MTVDDPCASLPDDVSSSVLLRLGTATLYEASGLECFLPPRLRPAWRGAKVAGPALPVSIPAGDNLGLHLALEQARSGDVLVVDAAAAPHGYWGEVLTVAAQAAGIQGLIIDGGVRDTDELERLRFPVFSSHVALEGTVKRSAGRVGSPATLGSVSVCPGDIVVADADGVVCLPRASAADITRAAVEREAKERGFIDSLRSGATTMQLYGFARPTVSAAHDV